MNTRIQETAIRETYLLLMMANEDIKTTQIIKVALGNVKTLSIL